MTTYEVTGRPRKINFGATGVDEVLQNVCMILTTPIFSVPLHRDWFIDYSLVDMPINAAQNVLAGRVFTAIRDHEPRARIIGPIEFVQTNDEAMGGIMIPRIRVEVIL